MSGASFERVHVIRRTWAPFDFTPEPQHGGRIAYYKTMAPTYYYPRMAHFGRGGALGPGAPDGLFAGCHALHENRAFLINYFSNGFTVSLSPPASGNWKPPTWRKSFLFEESDLEEVSAIGENPIFTPWGDFVGDALDFSVRENREARLSVVRNREQGACPRQLPPEDFSAPFVVRNEKKTRPFDFPDIVLGAMLKLLPPGEPPMQLFFMQWRLVNNMTVLAHRKLAPPSILLGAHARDESESKNEPVQAAKRMAEVSYYMAQLMYRADPLSQLIEPPRKDSDSTPIPGISESTPIPGFEMTASESNSILLPATSSAAVDDTDSIPVPGYIGGPSPVAAGGAHPTPVRASIYKNGILLEGITLKHCQVMKAEAASFLHFDDSRGTARDAVTLLDHIFRGLVPPWLLELKPDILLSVQDFEHSGFTHLESGESGTGEKGISWDGAVVGEGNSLVSPRRAAAPTAGTAEELRASAAGTAPPGFSEASAPNAPRIKLLFRGVPPASPLTITFSCEPNTTWRDVYVYAAIKFPTLAGPFELSISDAPGRQRVAQLNEAVTNGVKVEVEQLVN